MPAFSSCFRLKANPHERRGLNGLGENCRGRLGANMTSLVHKLWREDRGQDIAEYAVMLAVILVVVVGTIRLVGSHANTVFSNVASTVQ